MKKDTILWIAICATLLAGCLYPSTAARPSGESRVAPERTQTTATPSPSPMDKTPATPTPSRDRTRSATPTRTPTTRPSPTVDDRIVPHSLYSSLPEGQYVVSLRYFGDAKSLYAVSITSDFEQKIVKSLVDVQGIAISVDGKKIAFTIGAEGEELRLFILDAVEDTFREIVTGKGCVIPRWSPDNNALTVMCNDRIFIISLADGSKTELKVGEDLSFGFSEPVWSPDGKWIANISGPIDMFPYHTDGIYITATTCIKTPSTCPANTRGPISTIQIRLHAPLAWSPDNRTIVVAEGIAVSSHHTLQIINRETGEHSELIGGIFATGLAWAPIEEMIAYSDDDDIYLISPSGGEPLLLASDAGGVIGWLIILNIQVGDTLSITQSGADLNFRAAPSLDSSVLRKLTAGDIVAVIEGPIEADGYTWWKMRLVDGTEGWAAEMSGWYERVK